ncbi:MAG: SCO family protein [Crocinitomicaceae bacterium]|nr:SCO family protein [Crocinitomicaceae bacterium]
MTLIFTRCTGVCTPSLIRLKENLLHAKNKSLNVLVVSFDPVDSLKDLERMAQNMGLDSNQQWMFGVTDSIKELEQSISFSPVWDSTQNQFDHDALLVGINEEGYITKKLIGIRDSHDMDLLIASMNNIFSPTYRIPDKNTLFSCFNYDPSTGKNTPGLGLLFIALPSILSIFLILFVRFFSRGKSFQGENGHGVA